MNRYKSILTILSVLLLLCLFATAYAFDLSEFAIPQDTDIPEDAYGVWEVPSLKFSVPVYTSGGQETVDAQDSAWLFSYGRCYAIADHRGSSGKWFMDKLSVNDIAFMHKQDVVLQYKCFAIMKVEVHYDHYEINGRTITEYSSTDIICCCCADTKEENYLAFFRLVGVMP